jgi:copper chaperone CopZ
MPLITLDNSSAKLHLINRESNSTFSLESIIKMATVIFEVDMHCSGCSNAVTNILTKVPGVVGVECDIPTKMVTIALAPDGAPDPAELEAKLNIWADAASKPSVIRKS